MANVQHFALIGDSFVNEPARRLNMGAEFIASIAADALDSAAVNHPYLLALREGDFPNVDLAFKDFALQYGFYSANFMRYVSAVMGNLNEPRHKELLRGNLAEEQGDTHDLDLPPDVLESVNGVPHSRLYRRFQEALGLDPDKFKPTPQCPGQRWSNDFLALCETDECVGAGAIGIGTELIVSKIFQQILDGLKAHSNLTITQRVFFDLHTVCDEKHATEMTSITEDLAIDRASCEAIQHGVKTAITLRARFWDRLMDRARSFPASGPPTREKVPALGY